MCGSRTIAVASFACHWRTVCCEHLLGVRLDVAVEREEDVAAVAGGALLHRVHGLAERVAHDRRATRRPRQLLVQLELEPSEAGVVGARVAEHRRRDRALRIDAPLVGLEREARQVPLRERRRTPRRRLPLDVDEPAAAVGERRVQRPERESRAPSPRPAPPAADRRSASDRRRRRSPARRSPAAFPSRSKIVPRPAGSTRFAFVCACASAASDDARTVWIHAALAPRAAKVRRMTKSRRRSRELTTRAGILSVARGARSRYDVLAGRRLHEAEPARRRLDPRRGAGRGEPRGERLVLRLELRALLVELATTATCARRTATLTATTPKRRSAKRIIQTMWPRTRRCVDSAPRAYGRRRTPPLGCAAGRRRRRWAVPARRPPRARTSRRPPSGLSPRS